MIKSIFCLEGDWDSDLRSKRSIQPILDLLQRSHYPAVPSIRRNVATLAEFEHCLKKWTQQRYIHYPLLRAFTFCHRADRSLCIEAF